MERDNLIGLAIVLAASNVVILAFLTFLNFNIAKNVHKLQKSSQEYMDNYNYDDDEDDDDGEEFSEEEVAAFRVKQLAKSSKEREKVFKANIKKAQETVRKR